MLIAGGNCFCAISSKFFNVANNSCVQCPLGCGSCNSLTLCTTCMAPSAMSINGSGLCVCTDTKTYYNDTTSSCAACPNGCGTCTDSTLCLTCLDASMTIVSGLCLCPSGKYFNTSSCVACMSTCLTCSTGSTCTTCDDTKNFVFNTNTNVCVCKSGYTLSGSTCVEVTNDVNCSEGYTKSGSTCIEICGDGKLYEFACDDGNQEDGDGCDRNCAIEAGYVCKDGSPTSASICSYNGSLNLNLNRAIKNTYSNSIAFYITVSPKVKVLTQVDVNSVITTNLPINSIDSYYSDGQLVVWIYYNQSIQNSEATVNMTPPNVSNAWAMQRSSAIFIVKPDNNQPAIINDQSVYDFASNLFNIVRITSYTAIGLTLIGALFGRLIVLEMITAVQACMLTLVLIHDWHPYYGPVASYVGYVNGYNELFTHFPNLTTFTNPKTTLPIFGIGYQA
jgi:cysteine-rich repeat protein